MWPGDVQPLAVREAPPPDDRADEDAEYDRDWGRFNVGLSYDGDNIRDRLLRDQPVLAERRDPRERGWTGLAKAYARFVEAELNEAAPGEWRAPESSGITGGTGPGGGGDTVRLVIDLVNSAAATIALWYTVGVAVDAAKKRLRALSRSNPVITDGAAIALAARHLADTKGEKDLYWSSVEERRFAQDGYLGTDAYLVAFRSETALWIVTVDLLGNVLSVAQADAPAATMVRLQEGVIPMPPQKARSNRGTGHRTGKKPPRKPR